METIQDSFTLQAEEVKTSTHGTLKCIGKITNHKGELVDFDPHRMRQLIREASVGFRGQVDEDLIFQETLNNLYEGIAQGDLMPAAIMAARPFTERDPAYTFVTARLLLQKLFEEILGKTVTQAERLEAYRSYFPLYLDRGIEAGRIDPRLRSNFDLKKISRALSPERDEKFTFLGLQTLYDRYFIHVEEKRIELPQVFWMRVAMGLALVEKTQKERTRRAIEFYNILSSFDYVSSTPTLFNAGTPFNQLSSCFLTTVPDDLSDIYKGIKDNAMLSKFSGGLGNDWTPVRGLGARIKGTNGTSQGIIPFLKVANDTAIAVNQGGKRKGAVCSYLETWHIDIEEYLELRKNTGDDRRRCHDMNTANWVPDLFMKRVREKGHWTLFSPEETPDLHDLYGKEFEIAYTAYENKAERGEIHNFKKIEAVTLWRKMLSMLFETGHPWITFKDPSNLRSPQQHVGVVHSSNLCTEILLNTNDQEVAVCNLGSVNLAQHVLPSGALDEDKIRHTVFTAMRMLDNVIDQNFYPIPEAKNSNLKHRPVGLGLMGFQDCLYKLRVPYDSSEAVEFADRSMEMISYYAILASSELARERGAYESYESSLWDQGILPIDSLKTLAAERDTEDLEVNTNMHMDWEPVRKSIAENGMRNSNCMAIAPTATISNIAGISQSIEPSYKNLFVKSNMSGEFTIINPYLVQDLKTRGLWTEETRLNLKKYDGDLNLLDNIPQDLKDLYKTAFEIDAHWLIDCASRRQKWIDMGQSLNLYMKDPNGKKLDAMYRHAWKTGLKTTYYLRSLGATAVEKSTITTREYNNVAPIVPTTESQARENFEPKMCSIDDPECEACQ